jgi:hypothetical protein
MKQVAAALCGLVLLVLVCSRAETAPKPSDVSTSWELNFTCQAPKPIRVTVPGRRDPVTFWYVQYTVTNQTNNEQVFVPDFVLYTDTGQIIRAGQDVPGIVFRTIKQALNEPLLRDQADVSGTLLRGANNAKQGVMIFTDIDPAAGSFDIFVGGLSGETARIEPPQPVPTQIYDRAKKQTTTVLKDQVVLSKTLQLHYALPGEASARLVTAAALKTKTWIMR